MPNFSIRVRVTNNSGVPVKVHIGASLIGQINTTEFYNTSEDVTQVFNLGKNEFTRYLTTDLGKYQKYDLILVIWEGEKPIGTGIKYASLKLVNAVEKKKKIVVNMTLGVLSFSPNTFVAD